MTAAGMTWEGHHYCGYVFQHLGLFLRGLRGAGRIGEVAPPGSALEAKLHRVPHWYAHDLFPRGKWLQNYNDSHWDPSSSLLGFLLTFTEYEPALCAAVWDQLVGRPGRRTFGFDSRFSSVGEALLWFPDGPIRPLGELGLDDHFHCPEVGYVATRTGWDRGASVFTFNSGPLIGVVHDHADNNAFTYIARGAPLALDSGSANDPTPGSPSTAAGHNGVFVDGRGEATAGGGAGVSGRILAVAVSDDAVGVVGDATESYTAGGHLPLRRAHRHALFVRRPVPYLVTFDDLDVDDREHRFEYTVHVPSGDAGDTAGACTIGSNTGDPVGRLQVLHPDPASVELATEPYATQRRPRGPHNNHVRWSLGTTAAATGLRRAVPPAARARGGARRRTGRAPGRRDRGPADLAGGDRRTSVRGRPPSRCGGATLAPPMTTLPPGCGGPGATVAATAGGRPAPGTRHVSPRHRFARAVRARSWSRSVAKAGSSAMLLSSDGSTKRSYSSSVPSA